MMWKYSRDFLKQKHGLFIVLTPLRFELNIHRLFFASVNFFFIRPRHDIMKYCVTLFIFIARHIKSFFTLAQCLVPCWVSAIIQQKKHSLTEMRAAGEFPIENELCATFLWSFKIFLNERQDLGVLRIVIYISISFQLWKRKIDDRCKVFIGNNEICKGVFWTGSLEVQVDNLWNFHQRCMT